MDRDLEPAGGADERAGRSDLHVGVDAHEGQRCLPEGHLEALEAGAGERGEIGLEQVRGQVSESVRAQDRPLPPVGEALLVRRGETDGVQDRGAGLVEGEAPGQATGRGAEQVPPVEDG